MQLRLHSSSPNLCAEQGLHSWSGRLHPPWLNLLNTAMRPIGFTLSCAHAAPPLSPLTLTPAPG